MLQSLTPPAALRAADANAAIPRVCLFVVCCLFVVGFSVRNPTFGGQLLGACMSLKVPEPVLGSSKGFRIFEELLGAFAGLQELLHAVGPSRRC